MRFKQVGNKADIVAVVVHNDDTVTIPAGSPVILGYDATNDGLDVVLPSTSGGIQLILGLRYGISTKTMLSGDFGEAIVFGFHPSVTLLRQTRASSTNTWQTEAARSVGEYLTIDTVNNLMVTQVSTYQYVTASTAGTPTTLTLSNPDCVLGQTLASYASSASATSDTRTAITASVRAMVRMM